MLFSPIYRRFLVQITNNVVSRRLISKIPCNKLLFNSRLCIQCNNAQLTPAYTSLRFYAKGKDKKKEKGI